MGIQVTGIVRGEHTIEFDEPLPYEDGATVSVELNGTSEPPKPVPDPRKLLRLVGIGRSGISDVAENKHKYLAEAYSDWERDDPERKDPA